MLSSADIRGSSVYRPGELYEFYRDHLGKPIDLGQVQAIAVAIADGYERDGFARPQIRVRDDLVPLGILRIHVLEKRIGSVNIHGDPGPYRRRLEVMGAALHDGGIVRSTDLQATLRRMRDLPGLELSAATREDSASVYSLDVDARFRPFDGIIRLTNRGTDEVGPNYLLGQLVANGVFDGRTNLGVNFGGASDYDEYRGVGFLASRDIGNDGTLASVRGFRARSDPHETPVDLEDHFLRDRVTIGVTRPISYLAENTTFIAAALELEDLSIFRAGDQLRDERLRMLELSYRRIWRTERDVQYAGEVQLVKGLGGLNSGLDASDLSNDPRREDFLLHRFSLTRIAPLSDKWSWRLDGYAQQTAYILPYSQRFKIGGERLGRGFEIAEIAGDQGLGAKLELRRWLRAWPVSRANLTAYGFYDIGATWKQDVSGRESAATGGIGVRVHGSRASGSMELAKPLTHPDVEGKRDTSLFVEFNYRL